MAVTGLGSAASPDPVAALVAALKAPADALTAAAAALTTIDGGTA